MSSAASAARKTRAKDRNVPDIRYRKGAPRLYGAIGDVLTMVGTPCRIGRPVCGGPNRSVWKAFGKAVLMVVRPTWADGNRPREAQRPSLSKYAEIRFMSYVSVVHGAKGCLFHAQRRAGLSITGTLAGRGKSARRSGHAVSLSGTSPSNAFPPDPAGVSWAWRYRVGLRRHPQPTGECLSKVHRRCLIPSGGLFMVAGTRSAEIVQ